MPAYRAPTGKLLKSLRPEIYRQVVDLLAEPRNHVSYREISRVCCVSSHTIKAVERNEAETIAKRKAKLLQKSLRIADRAADRIEDLIDTAPLNMAVPAYGVAIEKALLLSDQPTVRIAVDVSATDIYSEFRAVQDQIREALRAPLSATIVDLPDCSVEPVEPPLKQPPLSELPPAAAEIVASAGGAELTLEDRSAESLTSD